MDSRKKKSKIIKIFETVKEKRIKIIILFIHLYDIFRLVIVL